MSSTERTSLHFSDKEQFSVVAQQLADETVKFLLYPHGVAGNVPKIVTEEEFLAAVESLQKRLENLGEKVPDRFSQTLEDAYFSQLERELNRRPGKKYRELEDEAKRDTPSASQQFQDLLQRAADSDPNLTLNTSRYNLIHEGNLTPDQTRQLNAFLQKMEENPNGERTELSSIQKVLTKEDGDIYISHIGRDGYKKVFVYSPTLDPDWHENLKDAQPGDILITKYGDRGTANILSRKLLKTALEE